jgi:cytoskeletal protein CcmA (bactofilin family)
MLSIRKQEPAKPSDAPAAVAPPKSVYDRFPSPRPEAHPAMTAAPSQPSAQRDDGPTDFVIGRGTRLKGEIEAGGDVIVEGEVEASIRAATMRIAAGGSVTGDVEAPNVEVRGRFQGTLNVRECLTVSGDGHVSGTVRYGELKVDRGARITGDIALVEDKAKVRAAAPDTKPEP